MSLENEHPARVAIIGYAFKSLDPNQIQAVEAHLATCPECQALVAKYQARSARLEAANPGAQSSSDQAAAPTGPAAQAVPAAPPWAQAAPPIQTEPPLAQETPPIQASPPAQAVPPIQAEPLLAQETPPIQASPPAQAVPPIQAEPLLAQETPPIQASPPAQAVPPIQAEPLLAQETPPIQASPPAQAVPPIQAEPLLAQETPPIQASPPTQAVPPIQAVPPLTQAAPSIQPAPPMANQVQVPPSLPRSASSAMPTQPLPPRSKMPRFELTPINIALGLVILLLLVANLLQLNQARLMRDEQNDLIRTIQANQVINALASEPGIELLPISGSSGQGALLIEKNGTSAILFLRNLPLLDSAHTYQAWLIPASGAPVSAGTFHANTGTPFASFLINAGQPLTNYSAINVTLEPSEGSSAPSTTPIIAVKL